LIVYNIPKHPAIDFIEGRQYYFAGDTAVQADRMLRNFHIEPSRTLHRISQSPSLPGLLGGNGLFSFHGKQVLIITGKQPVNLPEGLRIDLLVLSQNPRIKPDALRSLNVSQVVADGSNTGGSIVAWRTQCESNHVPFHSVVDNGAYTLALR
jgi:competence protein ComEC